MAVLAAACQTTAPTKPISPSVLRMPDNCGPDDTMEARLGGTFSETQKSVGVTQTQELAQLYVSPRGGTWSLVLLSRNGIACVVMNGSHWHDLLPGPKGSGA